MSLADPVSMPLTRPSGAPQAFHLLAKPTGAICNLDCKYCFFLSKEMLYPGSRFRMADDLLQTYIRQLLEVFFTIHDPTSLDRQGADVGTQYRSAIFYHNPGQKADAEQLIKELEAEQVWGKPIVTVLIPFSTFYPAEAYHQEYFMRNPYQGYCMAVIAPKVAKFRKKYLEMLKK